MITKVFEISKLLGPGWVADRAFYAVKRRSGLLKLQTPCKDWSAAPEITGRFFAASMRNVASHIYAGDEAKAVCKGWFRFFSHKPVRCHLPPNWFWNPFDENRQDCDLLKSRHWSKIPDFSHGDIKCIWELNRFAWVFPLVRAFQADPDQRFHEVFWQLIENWAYHNPPNTGIHWKCGQEIAIRMFALVTGYFHFQEENSTTVTRKRLLAMIIYESAKRIQANISYALSQQNNHGLSEAAGLFTAGILFNKSEWIEKGSELLEDQVRVLIYEDGSFSQHSANYHRVMLHGCVWAIQLGRANGFDFSNEFIERIRKAGKWLLALYDPQTGRMPNLGSNDGALILPYSTCSYQDFRQAIQAVGAVVDGNRWLPAGAWDDLAFWLVPGFKDCDFAQAEYRVPEAKSPQAKKAQLSILRHGGYAVFEHKKTKLVFRCPERFYHRPAQCDLLHVDLWHKGVNLFRDAGTYSYNCKQPWQDYFKSVAAHNTVQFGGHDQMPKISRFLYGKWPKLKVRYSGKCPVPYAEAEFSDWRGCRHKRRAEMTDDTIRITDSISGYNGTAYLRWRLAPELRWNLSGATCSGEACRLHVKADAGMRHLKITEGWESLYYQQKSPIPVLELAVIPPCSKIVTEVTINSDYAGSK